MKSLLNYFYLINSLYIWLFFSPVSILFGEEIASLSLNKSQAIQRALFYNQGLKVARLIVDQAKAKLKDAGKLKNPELHLDYAADRAFKENKEFIWEIGLEQHFPITQRLEILKKISAKELVLAQTEILNRERLLIGEVEREIVNLLHIKEQQTINQAQIELNKDFLKKFESLFGKGEISSKLLRKIKIEGFSQVEVQQQLEAEKLNSIFALKILIGWQGNLTILAEREIRLPSTIPPLMPCPRESLLNHPEYKIKDLLYEISQEKHSLVQAERWSDVAISVFYSLEKEPSFGSSPSEKTHFFGLGLSIPLPWKNRYQGTLEAAQIHQEQRLQEREISAQRIQNQINLLAEKTELKYQQAIVFRDQILRLVQINLEESENNHQLGQLSSDELYKAKIQWWNLQSKLLDKIKAFQIAYINWETSTSENRNHHNL